jgi:hypothetical protein
MCQYLSNHPTSTATPGAKMLVKEIVSKKAHKTKRPQPTDFEKNATKLRSKERNLQPKRPVPPVKHRP